MKKWQKIIGFVLFIIIGLIGAFWHWVTFLDLQSWKLVHKAQEFQQEMYIAMSGYATLMWISYLTALVLFVCLWRKGGNHETDL